MVRQHFPNMPLGFLDDPDNEKYHASYFNDFSPPLQPVWSQQDYVQISSKTRGMIMLGRSDGVLNPQGVRFGSAE